MEGGLERLGLGVDVGGVLRGQDLADFLDRRLDLLLGGGIDGVAQLGQLALGLVGGVLRAVTRLRQLALTAVVLGVRLGVGDHSLDLVLREARASLDLDLLLFARAKVLGRHVEDAVGIDVERDLDLRDAAGAGGIPVSWNFPSDLL